MAIEFPISVDSLKAEILKTQLQLREDLEDSEAANVLKASEQQFQVVIHKYTIANTVGDEEPVEYDWSNRLVPDKSLLRRNGYEQTVQGSGSLVMKIPLSEASTFSRDARRIILHISIVLTDEFTQKKACFDFGSWIIAHPRRCIELEDSFFNEGEVLFELEVVDRIGLIDIPNDIRWDVTFNADWKLTEEISRIFDRTDENRPWREDRNGRQNDLSFQIEAGRSEAQNLDSENPLRYQAGQSTWKKIVDEIAQLDSTRGALAFADETGQFRINRVLVIEDEFPDAVWNLNLDNDSVVSGEPQLSSRDLYNATNRWVCRGNASIGGGSTTVFSSDIFRDEDSIMETGRVVTRFVDLDSIDQRKLDQFARFVMHCELSDRDQFTVKTKPLPHLWHKAPVSVTSELVFGDEQPRIMAADEWELSLNGKLQTFTFRNFPREIDL